MMGFMAQLKHALKSDLDRTALALEVLEAIEKNQDHPMLHDRDVMNRQFGRDREPLAVRINRLDRDAIQRSILAVAQGERTQDIEVDTGMPTEVVGVLREALDVMMDPEEEELLHALVDMSIKKAREAT